MRRGPDGRVVASPGDTRDGPTEALVVPAGVAGDTVDGDGGESRKVVHSVGGGPCSGTTTVRGKWVVAPPKGDGRRLRTCRPPQALQTRGLRTAHKVGLVSHERARARDGPRITDCDDQKRRSGSRHRTLRRRGSRRRLDQYVHGGRSPLDPDPVTPSRTHDWGPIRSHPRCPVTAGEGWDEGPHAGLRNPWVTTTRRGRSVR